MGTKTITKITYNKTTNYDKRYKKITKTVAIVIIIDVTNIKWKSSYANTW